MNGCVVTEKTLVCYKGDDKPCTNKQTAGGHSWVKQNDDDDINNDDVNDNDDNR